MQNQKRTKDYYLAIDREKLPIEKGVSLSRDDILRRIVIMELLCQFRLSQEDLEAKYHLGFDLDFDSYFSSGISQLKALEADGLIKVFDDGIEVTPTGRLLIRILPRFLILISPVSKLKLFLKLFNDLFRLSPFKSRITKFRVRCASPYHL